jgi:hypothetical protein
LTACHRPLELLQAAVATLADGSILLLLLLLSVQLPWVPPAVEQLVNSKAVSSSLLLLQVLQVLPW